MKKLLTLLLLVTFCFNGVSQNKNQSNIIRTKVPVRPKGQTDMLQFAAPKIDTVRIGFIGLGMRGSGAIDRYIHIDGVQIKALCDKHSDRVAKANEKLKKANLPEAADYSGSDDAWKKLCERPDIDLIYICTDWKNHVPMAVYAMEHGKHVAIEVPAAQTLAECWQLINTSEKTRKHCMMLENCVYDFFEMTTLNMAQKGLFGEILHVEGSYIHNLEDFWDEYENDWRMKFNEEYRGDIYATHGMGPACQLLNIHRGDRMKYLVGMDTKSVNGPAYLKNKRGIDFKNFANGDHTQTMIRTENQKTILIQHDVFTPRPYSRMYQLTGTEGFANKYPISGYTLRPENIPSDIKQQYMDLKKENPKNYEDLSAHGFLPDAVKKALMEKYKHPIIKSLEDVAKKVGGHGGMDFIMDYRLIYCLHNGLPLDEDVYDAAEWSCLGELTRISIKNHSAPVEVPDFTRGGWNKIKGYKHAMAE